MFIQFALTFVTYKETKIHNSNILLGLDGDDSKQGLGISCG